MSDCGALDERAIQEAADVFRAYGFDVFNADPTEIKRFRNRLMIQYHPDRCGKITDAQRINAAYDILSEQLRLGANTRNEQDTISGIPVWAYAGHVGSHRPNATIFQSNYTDVNFIKKSIWELSLRSQDEYTIWGYEGASFRHSVAVYGTPRIFSYMATAMTELQTKGPRPAACRAVIVTDKGNQTFWLVYADGKYFDNPITLEHSPWGDNPSNDQEFKRQLPEILDRLRERRSDTH